MGAAGREHRPPSLPSVILTLTVLVTQNHLGVGRELELQKQEVHGSGCSAFPGLRDLGHQGASLRLSRKDKVPREESYCPSGSLYCMELSTWESLGWGS